ncbi:hypothetical protein E5554_14695 [Sphingobium sp. PAMC28499]|uniref:hypothetical protein n=1 Tax=Sphingobium sp. PAMC28499 TaxID=2565554 RepID=UPI00109E28F6|nr:hypothetical protein [Sphingobium sp. PAMC28499]QCB38961.1 hypothetical protein E5554_14695 [Sphingobium sp. PAMC28499]
MPTMSGVSGSDGEAGSDQPFIMLTPATRLSDAGPGVYIPSGTYTRLNITSANASNVGSEQMDRQVYPYKSRSAIARFFVGKRHSVTLSAKVTSGAFVATVPLVTVAHDSTRSEGEVFNRIIRQEARDFPLFLVRSNSASDVASATLDLKGTDKVESSAAGSALSAVVAATKLIAPAEPLLTTLSANTGKDTATAIDLAINQLFSRSIAEKHAVDRSVRLWTPIVVNLHLPRKQGAWSKLKQSGNPSQPTLEDLDYVHIGRWTLMFEAPRASSFASVTVVCPEGTTADEGCQAALTTARASAIAEARQHYGDILAFPLTSDGTSTTGSLASYLRQLDWWAEGVKALDVSGATADAFCRLIRGALTNIGLNDSDAALAAEAVAQSPMVTPKEGALMHSSVACHPA